MNEQPQKFETASRIAPLTLQELAAIRHESPGMIQLDWAIHEVERIIAELSARRPAKSA